MVSSFFIHPEVGIRAHIIQAARSLIGKARYTRYCEDCVPPSVVNCLMLAHWAFSQHGVWRDDPPTTDEWLTDRLKERGTTPPLSEPGDVLFVQYPDRKYEHVGILSSNDTVIHACAQRNTVVADSLIDFLATTKSLQVVSLLDNVACLTERDIEQYACDELPPQVMQAVNDHLDMCIECEQRIEPYRARDTF